MGLQTKPGYDPDEKAKALSEFLSQHSSWQLFSSGTDEGTIEEKKWKVISSRYAEGQRTDRPIFHYVDKVLGEIATNRPDVIIGHSMGGTIAYCCNLMSRHHPEHVIMLESPNGGIPTWAVGTIVPRWAPVLDMLQGSSFMKLMGSLEPEGQTEYHQIGGLWTWLFPKIFTMPGVPQKVFPFIRHSGLRTHPLVLEEILKIISS